MNSQIEKLETKRKQLFDEVKNLGDLRRGTITVTYKKCGKKNCICASPEHKGHGPYYQWSTTLGNGKSYAKNLKLGPEVEKVQREIANYKKYLELCKAIIEVNEEICDLRPVEVIDNETELEKLKKKLQRIYKVKLRKK